MTEKPLLESIGFAEKAEQAKDQIASRYSLPDPTVDLPCPQCGTPTPVQFRYHNGSNLADWQCQRCEDKEVYAEARGLKTEKSVERHSQIDLDQVRRCGLCGTDHRRRDNCPPLTDLAELERAVIEAAIEWIDEPDSADARERRETPTESALHQAVVALLKAGSVAI